VALRISSCWVLTPSTGRSESGAPRGASANHVSDAALGLRRVAARAMWRRQHCAVRPTAAWPGGVGAAATLLACVGSGKSEGLQLEMAAMQASALAQVPWRVRRSSCPPLQHHQHRWAVLRPRRLHDLERVGQRDAELQVRLTARARDAQRSFGTGSAAARLAPPCRCRPFSPGDPRHRGRRPRRQAPTIPPALCDDVAHCTRRSLQRGGSRGEGREGREGRGAEAPPPLPLPALPYGFG